MKADQPIKTNRLFHLLSYFLLLCFCIPLLTSCEGQKTIVNGLEEKDANEIIVFLSTKGIDAQKTKTAEAGGGGGAKVALWDIVVSNTQASEAMYLLNQQGLPRRPSRNLLGIFSTGGLVPSDLQEKIKYRAALSEQIASTIRKIDGILDADVQVSFPEEDPLNPGQMKGKITASVWVKHSGVLDDPNSHLITKIKRLVAASVTGLDYDNVTVIAERTRLGENPAGLGISAPEDEKQFVTVWSLIIGKESLTRFRIIFFTFCLALLALLLLLVWTFWKLYPVLEKHGGIKALFSLTPLTETSATTEKKTETETTTVTKKVEGPKKEARTVDKDVDET